MDVSELVTLKGGLVMPVEIIRRLIDLEDRGAEFHLETGGHFLVVPPTLLTPEDTHFIREHRDLVRDAIIYSKAMAAAAPQCPRQRFDIQ